MIVATRPEPTVRPPSRYMNSIFRCIFYTFYGENLHIFVSFSCSIFICMSSWHRFGTGMHLLTKLKFSFSPDSHKALQNQTHYGYSYPATCTHNNWLSACFYEFNNIRVQSYRSHCHHYKKLAKFFKRCKYT